MNARIATNPSYIFYSSLLIYRYFRTLKTILKIVKIPTPESPTSSIIPKTGIIFDKRSAGITPIITNGATFKSKLSSGDLRNLKYAFVQLNFLAFELFVIFKLSNSINHIYTYLDTERGTYQILIPGPLRCKNLEFKLTVVHRHNMTLVIPNTIMAINHFKMK
jgi:hypothetical protein